MIGRKPTGKFKDLQVLVRKITPDFISAQVGEVIDEMQNNMWARSEVVGPGLSVGMVMDIPGWYHDPIILSQMVASYMGRLIRAAAIERKIDPSDPEELVKMIPIMESTNIAESHAVKLLINATTKKYGLSPDYDPDNVLKLEQAITEGQRQGLSSLRKNMH